MINRMIKKDLIKILLLVTLLGLSISPLVPYPIFVLVFLSLLLVSFRDIRILFLLLGASNFLPNIFFFSPMVLIVFVLIIILIIKKTFLDLTNINFIILFILFVWILISSLSQNLDFSFLTVFVNGLITAYIVFLSIRNMYIKKSDAILFFISGMMINILIGYFSILNIFGFFSYNSLRLTFSRGDSNSIGLTFAFVTSYLAVSLLTKFKHRIPHHLIINIFLLLGSIHLLLLTGSRGSLFSVVLTFIIGLIILIIAPKKKQLYKKNEMKFNKIIMLISIPLLFILLLVDFGEVQVFLNDMYSFTFSRFDSNISDEIRVTLYKNALLTVYQNPIFGIGNLAYRNISGGTLIHNSYLEYLVNAGIFGLLLYLFAIGLVFLSITKTIIRGEIGLLPFFSGYIAVLFNQFTYSAVGDKTLWIPLAILITYSVKESNFQSTYRKK